MQETAIPTQPSKQRKLANSHIDASFRLDEKFIESYTNREINWSAIGYVVYKRTYARPLASVYPRYQQLAEKYNIIGTEEWWLTVTRVVEGVYRTQEKHCKYLHLPWSYKKAQRSAQEMFELIFTMKFLPPGRGLWAMGTEYVDTKTGMPLSNCAFISTEDIDKDFSKPFCFLMDSSMLGVGVGFSTLGAGKVKIVNPVLNYSVHEVEDSREGWVDLIKRILDSYTGLGTFPANIDYSKIRAEGELIRGFGGVAPGPAPLKDLTNSLYMLLQPLANVGGTVTSATIVDIFNLIGKCVVAGNTRRSAELALGSIDDEEYMSLKDPEINKEALYSHRWASNNSVVVTTNSNYSKAAELTAKNGEPGYVWLENCRAYGRMKDPPDWRDKDVGGVNPCQPGFATLLTPKGVKVFEEVGLGDSIWSGNAWTTIVGKYETGTKPVWKYTTNAGSFIGTANHRVVSNGKKIEVGLAKTIDVSRNPFIEIDNIRTNKILHKAYLGEFPVYDITVEDPNHTYWTDGLLVSNCGEVTLSGKGELCTLSEVFPAKHNSLDEFKRTLKFAYLYVKTVTLIPTHNSDTNAVMLKNRRVGTSISGITQAISKHGLANFMSWCDQGYGYLKQLDKIYSDWLCIPRSIKLTCTKPSGSVSLLNSSTPGIHFPHSKYYYRVVRMASTSILVKELEERGYMCIVIPNEPNTTAVYFPVMEEYFDRAKDEVSMWEQLELAAQIQYYWADNAVSISVSFKPEEAKDIERALELYGSRLKSVSFIPYADHKYEHAPYQKITEEEYNLAISKIKKIEKVQVDHEVTEKFCSNDSCVV